MALFNAILIALLSLVDLIKGTVIFSIPVFLFVVLGGWLKQRIDKLYKLSWLQSVLIATYIVTTLLILVLYFGFYWVALQGYDIGLMPESIQPSFMESLSLGFLFLSATFLKRLFIGLALALIILPFEFVFSFLREWLGLRYKKANKWAVIYAATFLTTLIGMVILYAFEWFLSGVLYLIFIF